MAEKLYSQVALFLVDRGTQTSISGVETALKRDLLKFGAHGQKYE